MEKTKVFISVAMSDRDDKDIINDLSKARADLVKFFEGEDIELIDNFEVCENPGYKRHCLGEAIKKLGECQYCYFVPGWENAKECFVEREVCNQYGIKIVLL